jgi:hypothetical protein
MTTEPDDLDALLQSILAEDDHPAAAVAPEALLSDPTFLAFIERATRPYERILTPKAMDHARRTLAALFTTDPEAASLLARLREPGPRDASGARKTRGVETAGRRRRRAP